MCFIVKYGLFIVNLLFVLTGLAFIGLGIAVLVLAKDVIQLIPIAIEAIPITIIVLGVVIAIIAFFGCCGSIRENRCFLIMYAICVAVIVAGKIYLTILIFSGVSRLDSLVEEWLGSAFNNPNLRTPFHVMEGAFRCCGTTGADSYINIMTPLPPSCCPPLDPDAVCDASNAFNGCYTSVSDFLEKYGNVFSGIMVYILIAEVTAIVFAVMLSCNITNKQRRGTV